MSFKFLSIFSSIVINDLFFEPNRALVVNGVLIDNIEDLLVVRRSEDSLFAKFILSKFILVLLDLLFAVLLQVDKLQSSMST